MGGDDVIGSDVTNEENLIGWGCDITGGAVGISQSGWMMSWAERSDVTWREGDVTGGGGEGIPKRCHPIGAVMSQ